MMEGIAISKLRATCFSVMERVRRTGEPVRVTRFGEPVAKIVPLTPPPPRKSWIGVMARSGRIVADIVSPASEG